MVIKKVQPVYLDKSTVDTIITIDDDWLRRYFSFTEIHEVNKEVFSNASNFGSLASFGLFLDSDFRGCIIKKEVYDWCIQSGFRYKKVRYETTNEFTVDIVTVGDYSTTTGILFNKESDAMAFKLRWL